MLKQQSLGFTLGLFGNNAVYRYMSTCPINTHKLIILQFQWVFISILRPN